MTFNFLNPYNDVVILALSFSHPSTLLILKHKYPGSAMQDGANYNDCVSSPLVIASNTSEFRHCHLPVGTAWLFASGYKHYQWFLVATSSELKLSVNP